MAHQTDDRGTSFTPACTSFAALSERLLNQGAKTATRGVLVVALGDSVTLGLVTNPELLHERAYHALLQGALAREFPTESFSIVNAGVNGDSTEGGRRRLQRDVLDHHADLVIVAFGLNDSGEGKEWLPQFAENLNVIVRGAQKSGAAVILMTPNMMATSDNGHVDPNYRHVFAGFVERQKSGLVAWYAEQIRQVGMLTGAPVADVYAEWERRIAAGEDMNAHLANGLNHPDAYGHRIACDLLLRTLLSALGHSPSMM